MSDATNEDSVETSKVTVGFVWSIAASGDAIQKYEDAEGELQAEQQFSCTDLQDVHTGTAVETCWKHPPRRQDDTPRVQSCQVGDVRGPRAAMLVAHRNW